MLVKIRETVETNENKKRLSLNIKGNMLKNTESAIYGQSNLYEKFSAKYGLIKIKDNDKSFNMEFFSDSNMPLAIIKVAAIIKIVII